MKCKRCLNEEDRYFYHGSRGWYCRKCIGFARAVLEEDIEPITLTVPEDDCAEYTLKYPLTPEQKEVSHQCAISIKTNDVLLQCVCGAGKTEMVLKTIAMHLAQKKKICFAIARRQVVLEIRDRLASIFTRATVIAVCGGHTDVLDADLIVCTTHQLYRYYQAFDCVILDEPDAFPFRGNDVLHGIAKTACRGHCIYLTATPDEELQRRVEEGSLKRFCLNRRPHGHPLPVPTLKTASLPLCFLRLLIWVKQHGSHARMVFAPTIRTARILARILNFIEPCFLCTSHTEDRDEVLRNYRATEHGLIVATTVLERGVTIKGADICVFHADHAVFDEAGLVQMAGRAGRTFEVPDGDVLFLCLSKSELCLKARNSIMEANHEALSSL